MKTALIMLAGVTALAYPLSMHAGVTSGGVYVNSDAWNFWIHGDIAALDREGLRKAVERDVDFYADGGGVKAVFYNMNFQRSFYPTKVGTPYWKDCAIGPDGKLTLRGKPLSAAGDEAVYRMMFNAVTNMTARFPEYMTYRYEYCHRKGVEMWHSMRMNDIHHTPLGSEFLPQHGDLWLDHKESVRAWYRHTWRGEWNDNALDYGRKEVYDYHLAMAREYLLDYPSDGFEFDWLRSAPVFKPGFDEKNMQLLTVFVRQVKAYALEAEKKWGRRIRLAHRVPARVRDAYGMGMDIAAWAREGLIDVLIPGGVPGIATEGDQDIAIYRALAPKPIVIAPEIDCRVQSRPGRSIDFDQALDAGFASGFYEQGADSIYFYNHFPRMDSEWPWIKGFFALAADRRAVAGLARRHALTWHQPTGEGRFTEENLPHAIWPKCCNGGVKINCGEATAGRKAHVVIGAVIPLEIDILVNTVKCPAVRRCDPASVPQSGKGETAYYHEAEIPSRALHDGWNDIEIFNNGDVTIDPKHFLWLEVTIEANKIPR